MSSSSAAAAASKGAPPGHRFRPTDQELVEFYLLPCARGEPAPFPGVLVEDDAAATTLPWKLFRRHHRADDNEAYFYVRGASSDGKAKAGERRCDGGGTWRGQRRHPGALHVAREKIGWSKYDLNLKFGSGTGSTGWVMHEYTIENPKPLCASGVKICHITFSGHGQKRKRVPYDHDDDGYPGDLPPPQRPRVHAPVESCSAPAPAMPIDRDRLRGLLEGTARLLGRAARRRYVLRG